MLCWNLMSALVALVVVFFHHAPAHAGSVIVTPEVRAQYITKAFTNFPDQFSLISKKDMFNGPPNPYGLVTHQTLECDFVQPSVSDPIGGTTPKFMCEIEYQGEKVQLKIKYDQQYNQQYPNWGRPNEEVYASVLSQRLLWGMGFGAEQSIPVRITCRNCPLEPW
jgi:hypothetical protein